MLLYSCTDLSPSLRRLLQANRLRLVRRRSPDSRRGKETVGEQVHLPRR